MTAQTHLDAIRAVETLLTIDPGELTAARHALIVEADRIAAALLLIEQIEIKRSTGDVAADLLVEPGPPVDYAKERAALRERFVHVDGVDEDVDDIAAGPAITAPPPPAPPAPPAPPTRSGVITVPATVESTPVQAIGAKPDRYAGSRRTGAMHVTREIHPQAPATLPASRPRTGLDRDVYDALTRQPHILAALAARLTAPHLTVARSLDRLFRRGLVVRTGTKGAYLWDARTAADSR